MESVLKFLDLPGKCSDSVSSLLSDTGCTSLFVSKMLGFIIILGSAFFKIPQILVIIKSKSGTGLSLQMFILELIGFGMTVVYNIKKGNPFSTYGETYFVIAQNIIILFFILHYAKRYFAFLIGLILYVALIVFSMTQETIIKMLTTLQLATIPIFAYSKIPQIWANFMQGGVGALSGLTCFIQVGGNAARVFTTLQEVDDPVILYGFLITFGLNVVLFLQVVYYSYLGFGKSSVPVSKGKKQGKKKSQKED